MDSDVNLSAREPVVRVVMLGFMCSGKTAVGKNLARRLGWQHVDLDKRIEAGESRTIPDIFAAEGEAHFRRLEARYTAEMVELESMVLSPGGGWITNPDLLSGFGPGTLSVWLRVTPVTVMRRLRRARDARPLLRAADPRGTAERLLAEREPLYRRADLVLDANRAGVAELARRLENNILRRNAV